jgi:predicted  nucleic acid-binding Zn-ribbon protein
VRQKLLDLHEIQKIDLEILETEKHGDGFQQRLTELEDAVKKGRAEVETLTDQRETIVREAKTLEGTVQAETIKIKKWEARLNEIRNQREYLALSREVEASKRANREAEEKILELMAQREQTEKRLDELQDKLAEDEVDCDAERAHVDRQMREAQEARDAIAERRAALVPKVSAGLLKKYDAIRAKRHGIGLVLVEDGCCQGCNMRLPPQLYNILQRGDSIEQCPTCQRIILWDRFLETLAAEEKAVEANP